MICKTLDGFEYKWKLDTVKKDEENVSGPHKKARELLKKKYPTLLILEEVQIQVKRNNYLYLDFYIPIFKLALEIDGKQHKEYNTHFNKSYIYFIKSKINDAIKSQWCELNNITLLRLDDDKSEEWNKQF